MKKGSWDSIHVIEVIPAPDGTKATYKLTTTVMLAMLTGKVEIGDANLSGSLTRQVLRSLFLALVEVISETCCRRNKLYL